MWGILHDGVLLRREPTIHASLKWASAFKGSPVGKYKTGITGVYDLLDEARGVFLSNLRRVDPKGVIAEYPVASLPNYRMSQEDRVAAQQIRAGDGFPSMKYAEYGQRASIILALDSVGWTERQIAEVLLTSRTYVMRVLNDPAQFSEEAKV